MLKLVLGAFYRTAAAAFTQQASDAARYCCAGSFAKHTELDLFTWRQISTVSVTDEIILSTVTTCS